MGTHRSTPTRMRARLLPSRTFGARGWGMRPLVERRMDPRSIEIRRLKVRHGPHVAPIALAYTDRAPNKQRAQVGVAALADAQKHITVPRLQCGAGPGPTRC